MRILAQLFYLRELELRLRQHIVDTLCQIWTNVVHLGKVFLLDLRVPDKLEHVACVLDRVFTLLFGEDAGPELARLVVFRLLALVVVVALAAHNIIADLIGRFCDIGAELVREAVGRVLFVASVVCIDAHLAVEIQRGKRLCHEWAVHGNLVQIDTDAVVLCVAVEEHAELKQWVGRVLDTRNHAAW